VVITTKDVAKIRIEFLKKTWPEKSNSLNDGRIISTIILLPVRQVVARHCVTFPAKRLKNILNSEFHILLKFSPLGLARIFNAILHSWCYRIFFALLKETRTGCIWYFRYMGDFVVLAKFV